MFQGNLRPEREAVAVLSTDEDKGTGRLQRL
jgi:hypothetical protein